MCICLFVCVFLWLFINSFLEVLMMELTTKAPSLIISQLLWFLSSSVYLPTLQLGLFVFPGCMCMCLWLACVWAWRMHTSEFTGGGQNRTEGISLYCYLSDFLETGSSIETEAHLTISGKLAGNLALRVCSSSSPNTGGIGTLSHSWLYTWVLGIHIQILLFSEQAMFPTMISFQP